MLKRQTAPWLEHTRTQSTTQAMTTSISDKESPRGVGDGASVLGFTSSLLSTLKSSQHTFDDWVQTQRERADAAAAAHNDLVEAQRAEIEGLEAELEAIRANLGVGGGAGAGEDNDEAAEVEGDANNGSIARQREQMKQRQAEIERSIADLHLRQGEKQRELEGELCCIAMDTDFDVLFMERHIIMCLFFGDFGDTGTNTSHISSHLNISCLNTKSSGTD